MEIKKYRTYEIHMTNEEFTEILSPYIKGKIASITPSLDNGWDIRIIGEEDVDSTEYKKKVIDAIDNTYFSDRDWKTRLKKELELK